MRNISTSVSRIANLTTRSQHVETVWSPWTDVRLQFKITTLFYVAINFSTCEDSIAVLVQQPHWFNFDLNNSFFIWLYPSFSKSHHLILRHRLSFLCSWSSFLITTALHLCTRRHISWELVSHLKTQLRTHLAWPSEHISPHLKLCFINTNLGVKI